MLNAKWSHALAVVLATGGSVLHFLQVNPALASEVHVTGNAMLVFGFIVALASEQIFGTPTPPKVPPIAQDPVTTAAAKIAPLGILTLCYAFIATPGCKGPVIPVIEAVVQVVERDIANGASDPQMASDVCQALGGSATTDAVCAGVEALIQDAVQLLIDSGTLSAKDAAVAQGYLSRHPKVSK